MCVDRLVGQDAGIFIVILHEESRCVGLTVAKNASMIETDFVTVAENGIQDAIVYELSSALQVLKRLIASRITDQNFVVHRRLQESIACSRLNLVIPDLLELL